MKYFVFSDVHGCYEALIHALNKAGFDEANPNHHLLFLGDAFNHNDKHGKYYETFKFLKDNMENNKLTWIMGNHDQIILNAIKNLNAGSSIVTIRDIATGLDPKALNYSDAECLKLLKDNNIDEFINNNTIHYYETNNYVFTHGFIPYNKKEFKYDENWRNVDKSKWGAFKTSNGQKLVLNGIKIPNKTLVCGHVGAYFGNLVKTIPDFNSLQFEKEKRIIFKNAKTNPKPFEIYYGDGVIGIDTRSYDTNMVNILIIEE